LTCPANDFGDLASRALGLSFTNADDRRHASGDRRFGLLTDEIVTLLMILAALRMADDDVLGARIGQHAGADLPCSGGVGLVGAAILGPDQDGFVAGLPGGGRDIDGRRADQDVDLGGGSADRFGQCADFSQIAHAAKHLPISRDERLSRRHTYSPGLRRCGGVRQLPRSGGLSMVRRLTHTERLMLLQFRNITRGWIATIIVALVGLATVLFLIPQNGMNLAAGNALATVGGRNITAPELTRELDLTLRGERDRGNNISSQDAINAGYHLRLLEGMISRVAMYVYADKIGVSASDEQVAARIREIPAVNNAVTGAYDEAAYNAFLQQMRYGRQEFERDVRGDLTTQMIVQSLMAGVRAPTSFGALTYAFDAEVRVVSVAEAPASAVGTIPQPNDAQIQAFYEDSQEALRLPEFRGLTLVYARPADFVTRVNVPEARIREEFDARAPSLTQPERRTYVRIAAPTEAQANEAAERVNRGESAAAVAQAMSLQVTRGENQAQAQVPDDAVGAAVFRAQVRGPAIVARGELSPFVVVRVESSTPAVAPSFAEAREEIRNAIAADEAHDLLSAAVSTFEEARASGTPLADAARQAGLPVVSIPAVEAGGRDQQGRPVEALTGHEELVATAFQTLEGEATDFIAVGEADVIAGVDRIIPASVRPLEAVRADLVQAWIGRERARRLRELGEQIVTAVNGGQTLAQAAGANRARVVVSSRSIDRRGAAQALPQGLAGQMFAVGEGTAFSQVSSNGVLIAVVEHINRPDIAAADPQILEATRLYAERPCMQQALQAGAPPYCGLSTSVMEALQGDIVHNSNPRRNERVIANTYRASNAEEDAQQ
jgi:peptidyl-prolyl cis-trans isomerase D